MRLATILGTLMGGLLACSLCVGQTAHASAIYVQRSAPQQPPGTVLNWNNTAPYLSLKFGVKEAQGNGFLTYDYAAPIYPTSLNDGSLVGFLDFTGSPTAEQFRAYYRESSIPGKIQLDVLQELADGKQIAFTPNSRFCLMNTELPSTGVWQATGVGRFTNDGRPGVLFTNLDHSMKLVTAGQRTMQGNYPVCEVAEMDVDVQSPAITWRLKGIADFNRDGVDDLLWYHNATRKLDLWLMGLKDGKLVRLNEADFAAGATTFTGPANTDLAGVDDFTNDGHPDLLFYSYRLSGSVQNVKKYVVPTVVQLGALNASGQVSTGRAISFRFANTPDGMADALPMELNKTDSVKLFPTN